MKLSLERKIALGFAAAALVLALVAGGAVWNLQRLRDTFGWVDHTHEAIRRLQEALTGVLRMQASARGYVLTGSEEMLQPFRAGEVHFDTAIAELRRLTADNPAQQERLTRAEALAHETRQMMLERIDVRRRQGGDQPRDTPVFLQNQSGVEQFRLAIDEMENEEQRLLAQRFGATERVARWTLRTIVGASGLAILLASAAGFVAVRDLRARRKAEGERDRIFNLTRDLVCVAAFDGVFKRINPAWFESLGYAEDELLDRPFLDFVHPDDRPQTAIATASLRQGSEVIAFENRYRRRDGTYRWLLWNARPLPREQLIVASARDITERKETDQKIRELNRSLEARTHQLENANRELESFSYSVSHDLRAPLRHIEGFSSLLVERAPELDAESQRFIGIIVKAAQQMSTLIDDLLALSRVSRTELLKQTVDQNALVAGVIADGRYGTAERPIAWDLAPLPAVQADAGLLRQVWANLIDNAVKYSGKAAAPRIRISATADPARGEQVFAVEDNGVGFDMASADRLFGVFQRLHSSSEFEGTGVGLANVQRIVTRHGGRVWAESQPGAGATFFFSLPDNEQSSAFV